MVNGKKAKPCWPLYSAYKSIPSSTYQDLAVENKREIIPLAVNRTRKEIAERV